jgi:ribonuclease HI
LHVTVSTNVDLDLRLGFKGEPQVYVYIDASFAVHDDYKWHSGTLVTLGTGAYYTKSTTQKLNTTSSCEAELVALAKGMQQALWSRAILSEMGYPANPILVYQDSQSTIKLVEKGRPGAKQSRHIKCQTIIVTSTYLMSQSLYLFLNTCMLSTLQIH